ncbi:ABC transporter substrate-binding protein [Paenibacillus agaridevorans]|uniref:ABC transporter substrate-binding protein n=1 Tax=Paenibacillus agaridevorans TaxID=171404 RepID=A0A2R5EZM9_9BACL|nr:zinc ABC transporter substrate-binding protein [Paenibacillus agaridevorans]GBG12152.1 ABC transporter substrate-binding protein [Paenibacillus agaridevorans]
MKLSHSQRPFRPIAAAMLSAMLVIAGCAGNNNGNAAANNTAGNQPASAAPEVQKLSVVTSFYPLYYLTSEIGGEHVEVTNLISSGVEPHDWTPKSQDLNKASKAELFLYHGAGLETWVEDFTKGLSGDSAVMVKAMSEGIDLIKGEEDEDEDSHDHSHEDEHHHAIDPHTWVSPKSVLVLAQNVKNSLIAADADNAAVYEQNYTALHGKLTTLDKDYAEKLGAVKQKNIVVSHEAFGYLARDYGLNQVSIMGLNPDAEPRAQDILKIAKFVKENDVKYIFFEELVSDQLAVMLANEAKVETMVLNPLEGLTKEQEKAGITYLNLMQSNLQNLVQALQ